MTRQEAIQELDAWRRKLEKLNQPINAEAWDMAVDALRSEQSSQKDGGANSKGNRLRDLFNPTGAALAEQNERLKRVFDDVSKEKGCATCAHCIRVCNYPGFSMGEECICNAGLECDTVLFQVKKCKKYAQRRLDG